nr:PQQ-binding-like beta-propeller repeat protein [Streptomyces sp. NBC_00830]
MLRSSTRTTLHLGFARGDLHPHHTRLALVWAWSAPVGTVSKFSVPATDGGRVYVGTRNGYVLAFGRPSNSALTGNAVAIGKVPVGSTGKARSRRPAGRPDAATAHVRPAR